MLYLYLPETNIFKIPLTILVKASRNSSSEENVTRSPSVSENKIIWKLCSDSVVFFVCSDSVVFCNCSDSVVFCNCSESVVFCNCHDSVVFCNCSDSVVFCNCFDSVVFFVFHFIIMIFFLQNTEEFSLNHPLVLSKRYKEKSQQQLI